jgi:DNA-directed RNA polymerase specialized sigma24 family protein
LGNPGLETVAEEAPTKAVPPKWLEQLPSQLAMVSPAARAVLILHYVHGLTLGEVAIVLELSLGTVKSRLAYGLAALRQRLGKSEDFP